MTAIMRGCVGAWASPAAELAASQSPEVLRQSALQHHETFLIRWACFFEEQETAHSLSELAQRRLIQTWRTLAELSEACSPDALIFTKMKKTKQKRSFIYADYCAW